MHATNTPQQIMGLAKAISSYITFSCNGESESFEVSHDGLVAFIDYKAEYRREIGGSYEDREFEILSALDRETVEVDSVWDEEGREIPSLVNVLQKMLN